MDDRSSYQPLTAIEPGDGFVREPLPREPRPPRSTGTLVLLGALAALLVITVVGTTFLVISELRTQAAPPTSTRPSARTTAAVPTSTPTPLSLLSSLEPKENGWTQVTHAAGDVKFSASNPQQGYLCGRDQNGLITFGVTTNGGKTWKFGQSPAANESCSIQISPTNALDVVVNSEVGNCAAPCPSLDAHYSRDGGMTWQAAPIPKSTVRLGGALWSGAYLYVWSSAIASTTQRSFLKVSAYGGPFTSIDLKTLLRGAQNVNIGSPVVSGTKLYLNLSYSGCSSQTCQAIVASSDGGKTWTQIPNESSIQLVYVVGTALYGQLADTQDQSTETIVKSTDGGATWTPLTLPPLPNGQTVTLGDQTSWAPAPDGAFFMAFPDLGAVAYLRAGVWTLIPFGPGPDGYTVATVTLDAKGQLQRVWGLVDAGSSRAGIYWHALP